MINHRITPMTESGLLAAITVIMETFGGGGHQNVAGAQVQNKSLEEVCQQAITLSKKYIEENDKDESNLTARY